MAIYEPCMKELADYRQGVRDLLAWVQTDDELAMCLAQNYAAYGREVPQSLEIWNWLVMFVYADIKDLFKDLKVREYVPIISEHSRLVAPRIGKAGSKEEYRKHRRRCTD